MIEVRIDNPEELLEGINQSKETLEGMAREALLVRLYDLGEISSGRAARLLGTSRVAFLDTLGRYHVSIFDPTMDVVAEARLPR